MTWIYGDSETSDWLPGTGNQSIRKQWVGQVTGVVGKSRNDDKWWSGFHHQTGKVMCLVLSLGRRTDVACPSDKKSRSIATNLYMKHVPWNRQGPSIGRWGDECQTEAVRISGYHEASTRALGGGGRWQEIEWNLSTFEDEGITFPWNIRNKLHSDTAHTPDETNAPRK